MQFLAHIRDEIVTVYRENNLCNIMEPSVWRVGLVGNCKQLLVSLGVGYISA